MLISFEDRLSDSPLVERVWRSHSNREGSFSSIAATNFEMVVTRYQGKTFLTLRGPETKPTAAHCPAGGDWLGIRFKLGAFLPKLTPGQLRDRNDVTLPDASSRSLWLDGSAWHYPDFENADTFVARLVRKGILSFNPDVQAAMEHTGEINRRPSPALRSAQRHFLRATGISRRTAYQIERARQATWLLRQGASILDTVYETGYFDQAHLTRSLKHLVGHTPTEIARGEQQLSFLYKTNQVHCPYDLGNRPLDQCPLQVTS